MIFTLIFGAASFVAGYVWRATAAPGPVRTVAPRLRVLKGGRR